MKIKTLPVYNGDSIIASIETDDGIKNILIDGGIGRSIVLLTKEIERLNELGQKIDLLIITHIDDDHIGGIIKLFSRGDKYSKIVRRVWYNSGSTISSFFNNADSREREIDLVPDQLDISVKQGNTLEKKLEHLGIWQQEVIHNNLGMINFFGALIQILSPSTENLKALNSSWQTERSKPENISSSEVDYDKNIEELVACSLPSEDNSITNGSSIAFIIEHKEKKAVFLSDAHPSTVVDSLIRLGYSKLKPLVAYIVKISHHGSSRNINTELLELIDCNRYIISTNGSKHGLPNKLCLAKIIANKSSDTELFFNYSIVKDKSIFLNEDYAKYKFKCFDLSETTFNYEITL
jgi:beta-lactamase superfamily II metal-dependent hydrolase